MTTHAPRDDSSRDDSPRHGSSRDHSPRDDSFRDHSSGTTTRCSTGTATAEQFTRTLRHFESFAVAFSFISITTGIFTTYGFALATGGPRSIWTC